MSPCEMTKPLAERLTNESVSGIMRRLAVKGMERGPVLGATPHWWRCVIDRHYQKSGAVLRPTPSKHRLGL